MSIICEECGRENCKNNDQCIGCGAKPLKGSTQDINHKIVVKFLREKKILGDVQTSFIVTYKDGSVIDFVKLMTELLNRREK